MAFHSVQRAAAPRLKDRRILVVEDDWFTADALADLLAKEGADVFGAGRDSRGRRAARRILADRHRCAGLELTRPEADDLVVELARKGIPVVVVTAYDIKQTVVDHAFATLKKPVASAVLLDTLHQAANASACLRLASRGATGPCKGKHR